MSERRVADPRLIVYVGKGGTGKTTIAAATAVRAAALGYRSLVVSTDIAHSLGDVLDVRLGAAPTAIGERLFAQEVNVLEETRREWGRLHDSLAALFEREGLSAVQADELAVIPGMEEVAALMQIARSARSGDYDCIVVDAAPTGETIRLLSMPESFVWYAGRLEEWRGRLMRFAAPLLRGVVPQVNLAGVARKVSERVRTLRELLVDPARSSYRLIVTADRTVIKEARRAETYLNIFQYPIDAVILNRLIPVEAGGTPYVDALLARQAQGVDEVQRTFPTLPLLEAPFTLVEPVGLEALAELGTLLFGERDPIVQFHAGPTMRVEKSGDGFVLRIPMPNVEITKLALRKVGDELYIDVGNVRRELMLPLALVDLEPGKARISEGALEIPFSQ
ncbi:MAG TPA: TRC40/GET3/ArsA family transport-energizing ATPase [Candidatus Acidoferrum sp.]|nr:TRC40/GET3/ArsA family transport-energizing ATPase [Candidatus Acidoferrum sp.]